METFCRLGGFLCQLLIIGQSIVLYIGKGSGHLLNVKYLTSLDKGTQPFVVCDG